MNSSENIKNAFTVVVKTYENIEKLMNYCDNVADNYGYIPISSKFLRRRSDNNPTGWLYRSLIKVYQAKENFQEDEDGWCDGPVYTMEFNFEEEPNCYLSKFEYEDITSWNNGISPTEHWGFYFPTDERDERHSFVKIEDDYIVSTPKEGYKDTYWGLERVIFRVLSLLEINGDNAGSLIFGEFDKLKDK
ncbi:hypothetical protein [Clostridium sp. LP20]|uniref:hypothetical protein n=1 Tax=Clostridium sp. LP20 TaxID=3418665 RepID=UPI003EE6D0DB